jgi:hypothetical protein
VVIALKCPNCGCGSEIHLSNLANDFPLPKPTRKKKKNRKRKKKTNKKEEKGGREEGKRERKKGRKEERKEGREGGREEGRKERRDYFQKSKFISPVVICIYCWLLTSPIRNLIFPIGFSHLPVVTSALPCDLTTTNPKRSDVLAAQSDPWYLPQVHDAFS